jgi:hypothetical protein
MTIKEVVQRKMIKSDGSESRDSSSTAIEYGEKRDFLIRQHIGLDYDKKPMISHVLVENYDEWANLELPAYCWYNNDSLNSNNFGALRKGSIASQELLVYRIDKDTIPVHPGHDQRCLALKVEKRFHHAMQYDSAL